MINLQQTGGRRIWKSDINFEVMLVVCRVFWKRNSKGQDQVLVGRTKGAARGRGRWVARGSYISATGDGPQVETSRPSLVPSPPLPSAGHRRGRNPSLFLGKFGVRPTRAGGRGDVARKYRRG